MQSTLILGMSFNLYTFNCFKFCFFVLLLTYFANFFFFFCCSYISVSLKVFLLHFCEWFRILFVFSPCVDGPSCRKTWTTWFQKYSYSQWLPLLKCAKWVFFLVFLCWQIYFEYSSMLVNECIVAFICIWFNWGKVKMTVTIVGCIAAT